MRVCDDMRTLRSAVAALGMSVVAFCQAPPAKEFEVASIRPSAPLSGRVNLHLQIDGAQVHGTWFSLKDYLTMAYRLKEYQIVGPPWIGSERFDLAAKLPAGAGREQVPEMLQALVAKGGVKIKESPATAEGDIDPSKLPVNVNVSGGREGTTVSLGKGSYFSMGNNRIQAHKLPMIGFADMLARFVDRPVVDMTDMKGLYDFTVEFSPEDFHAMMIRGAVTAGVILPPEALR